MKDLEETKKEILDYIKKSGFSIFYGSVQDVTVMWSQGDWKDFINISKNEGVKTIIYHDCVLSEELAELSAINEYPIDDLDKQDVQFLKDLRSKSKSFTKFSEKIAYIQLVWIKEGDKYMLQLSSPWYDEFHDVYEKTLKFLEKKERETERKTAETILLEKKKESLKEIKEKLSLLSTKIVEWAKSQKLNRVTKGQVQVYLLENEIPLGWTETITLYTMVNKELAKSYAK